MSLRINRSKMFIAEKEKFFVAGRRGVNYSTNSLGRVAITPVRDNSIDIDKIPCFKCLVQPTCFIRVVNRPLGKKLLVVTKQVCEELKKYCKPEFGHIHDEI